MAEPKGPLINFAFVLLGLTAVLAVLGYAIAISVGFIAAFPFGLLGFIPLVAVLILLYMVIRDQTTSKEDKFYSDNVDQ